MKKDFIEKIHYYLENGKVVFTEQYHIDRGIVVNQIKNAVIVLTPIKKILLIV